MKSWLRETDGQTLDRMRYFGFIILISTICGCTSPKTQLSLAHDVNVPKEFRAGSFSEDHFFYSEGNSAVERYVGAYEHGWAECVQRFAKNIDFDDPSPFIYGGWVEEQAGGGAGYVAAGDRIDKLIRIYGKQKVSNYLQQFKLPDEELSSASLQQPTDERLTPHQAAYEQFALSSPLYLNDWRKLQVGLVDAGVHCNEGTADLGTFALLVDSGDFATARSEALKLIAQDSLTIRLRTSSSSQSYEIWQKGKRLREETY